MEFFHTHISPRAVELVKKTLESTWLSEGEMVAKFEDELSMQLGVINPVAVNSGTSALHLGLIVAGVKQGDEVILPAQTFVATGLVILQQLAKPVFADIQYETGNIAPDSIRQKITDRTKAIMPVHWGGYPCDMEEINQIASEHNLAAVEDAAHALGATYHNKPLGSISRFTIFSFQAIKHLTTGDGGMLCCLKSDDYEEARKRRWFGIDRKNSRPSLLGEREYDISSAGYKYHMNDLAASVGLGNLSDFPKRLKRRQQIGKRYREELAKVPGVTLLELKNDRTHAFWIFTMHVERREDFIKMLKSKQIPSSVVHLRIDHNSVFGGVKEDLTNQAKFNETQISIPVHEGLTDDEIGKIIKVISSGW